jgi:hypothetical protein
LIKGNEAEELMRALEEWAYRHPKGDRPFLIFMGRSFTPVEYFLELRHNEEFREALFGFLEEQSRRSEERPIDMIVRAIVANRV